jgi:hypothetical protein
MSLCTITQLLLFVNEIVQMYYAVGDSIFAKISQYFSEGFWNYVEFSQFFVFLALLYIDISSGFEHKERSL